MKKVHREEIAERMCGDYKKPCLSVLFSDPFPSAHC